MLSGTKYPPNRDSRLISPMVAVPPADQSPRLRFWHWFDLDKNRDFGRVEARVVGSDQWQALSTYTGMAPTWGRPSISLIDFAGQTIQLSFRLRSDGSSEQAGWFVDDVVVESGPIVFANPEDFESGLGDWSTESGTWEVGVPAPGVGPGSAHGDSRNCAGTILAGNYRPGTLARLESPAFMVPSAEWDPRLRFWHWFDLESGRGLGHVQVYDASTGAWHDFPEQTYTGNGRAWTQPGVDISSYAGKTIKVGFLIETSEAHSTLSGWYIDDVRIQTSLLPRIPSQTVNEGQLLQIQLPGLPAGRHYITAPGTPAGAMTDELVDIFTWVPDECQGLGTYTISVGFAEPGNSLTPVAATGFTVTVLEVNDPPSIDPIPTQRIQAGRPVSFTVAAYDPDCPADQVLRFALDDGAPARASIDSITGVFTWIPTPEQAKLRHRFSVRVTDSGSPPRSANTFLTAVPDVPEPILTARRRADGGIELLATGQIAGQVAVVQATSALPCNREGTIASETAWTSLATLTLGMQPIAITDPDADQSPVRFYRLLVNP